MADPNFGSDLSLTYCTTVLPYPNGQPGGTLTSFTGVQLTLGWATDPRLGTTLPAMSTGRATVAEAVIRRLVTARGTLIDIVFPSTTANYGYDIANALNDDITARVLGMLGANIEAELRKDERIIRAPTTVTSAGDVLIVSIQVFLASGPFKLVLAISQVSVSLLSGPS